MSRNRLITYLCYLDAVYTRYPDIVDDVHTWILSIPECCTYLYTVHTWMLSIPVCCTYPDAVHTWMLYIPGCCTYLDAVHTCMLYIHAPVSRSQTQSRPSTEADPAVDGESRSTIIYNSVQLQIQEKLTYEKWWDGASVTMQCVDADAIVSTEDPNGVILGTCQQSTTLQAKSHQEGWKWKSKTWRARQVMAWVWALLVCFQEIRKSWRKSWKYSKMGFERRPLPSWQESLWRWRSAAWCCLLRRAMQGSTPDLTPFLD